MRLPRFTACEGSIIPACAGGTSSSIAVCVDPCTASQKNPLPLLLDSRPPASIEHADKSYMHSRLADSVARGLRAGHPLRAQIADPGALDTFIAKEPQGCIL